MNDTAPMDLDAAVQRAHRAGQELGLPAPDALMAPSTGALAIAESLENAKALTLSDVDGVPARWARTGSRLFAGTLGGATLWIVEDADEFGPMEGDLPWERAFPVWWAAAAGAVLFLHTSAGTSLKKDGTGAAAIAPGTFVRLSDHINLSGSSPLSGLGESRLGPLFPDQTRVHNPKLGELADACAAERGVPFGTAVAACTLGPALSTPAELRWYAAAGADVAVQRLADPMIAAAHAGLSTLAICAVTDSADESPAVPTLIERAAAAAPVLDGLMVDIAARLMPLILAHRDAPGL